MTIQGTEQFANDINKLAPQEGATTDESTQAPLNPGEGGEDGATTEETTNAPAQEDENKGGTDDEPLTVIDQLRTAYGVEEALENSVDSIQKLVDIVSTKKVEEGIKARFEQKPILKQLDEHLEAGKSPESFFQVRNVEAGKLEIVSPTGDATEDAKITAYYKEVIKANYAETGLSEKQINRILESSELEGTIEDDYKEAVEAWNGRRDLQAQQISEAEQARVQKEMDDAKESVLKINSLVDAGTIGGAIIPAAERADFKKFLLEQDENGLAERDRKLAELPLEKYLLIDYLIFKEFNVKGLALAPNKRQELADLNKDRSKDRMQGGGGGSNAADQTKLPESLRMTDFSQLQTQ